MKFAWDETKRKSNLIKHALDFIDAMEVFEGATITIEDSRFGYGEQRFITIGMSRGRVVAIAHTEHGDEMRIISMRKATQNEENFYFKEIADGMEAD